LPDPPSAPSTSSHVMFAPSYPQLFFFCFAASHTVLAAIPESTLFPNPTSAALADLSIEELMDVPIESVSGVSKYEQSIRRAPAGVTIFTAADIRNHGWITLSDALRAAPGLHVRSDRFYDYVGMRGFTRAYDYNSRTLILLDGHRVDDPIFQQGAIGTDFILDLDMVDRIEIISGPGSAVYGSNAFFGAVNVIPKTGRDIAGTQAGLTLGSEPSAKARFSVGDRTDGGVDYVISGTEWWSRGEADFDLPASWRAVDPVRLRGDVAENKDDMHHRSVFGRVSWRGLTGEAAYARRDKEVLPFVYYTPNDTDAHGVDERAYLLLRASGEPTPESSLQAKVALDVYRYRGYFNPPFLGFVPFTSYADSLSVNTEVRWRRTFADVHSLSVGVEHQENLRQDFGADLPASGTSYYRFRGSSGYVSPFAQLDWEFTPRLRASLGGRYDHYDTGDERATPRAGLIWDPTDSTTLKLLYGEAFRVPNVSERSLGEAGIVQNPDIRPETNRSWEIVAEQRFGSVWRVEAHAYHTVSSDLITTILTNSNPSNPDELTYGNVQRFMTRGFDIGPVAYFSSGVQLRSSVSFQETIDDATGEIVADAPKTLVKLHVSTPLVKRWLRASAELLYVGDRKDSGGIDAIVRETDDYVTLNATLLAARVAHRWDLSLSVYNIADARWSDPKNVGQISSPPRSVVFRAQVEF
jgi:outer membrane receptor for ferrienterochelin and colicins